MSGEKWPAVQGAVIDRMITVVDANGVPVAYAGTEPISFVIWLGDNQPALTTITPTWNAPSSPGAGQVNVVVGTTQTAAWPPGTLRWVLTITDAEGPKTAAIGEIEVAEQPGTATALSSDITFDDLMLYAPHLESITTDNKLGGFTEERHRAQTWYREQVRDNFRPIPGRDRRQTNSPDTAAGQYIQYNNGGNATPVPTPATLYGYLQAGGLQLTDRIRETQAHYAAALVLMPLPGDDYQKQAAKYLASAKTLAPQCINEVDPTGGSNPTMRIDRDVIWLS